MNKKEKGPNLLGRYFHDVRKFPILSEEEERKLSSQIKEKTNEIKEDLMALPEVWEEIASYANKIVQEDKSFSKMSNLYGATSESAKELAENIKKCMSDLMETNTREQSIVILNSANIADHIYFSIMDKIEVDESLTKKRNELIEARNKFLCSNLRLVLAFAIQYQHLGIPIEDLIQEGNEALIKAIGKFDPDKHFKFSTYASWWIKESFVKLFKTHGRTVRLPSNIHELASKIQKTARRLEKGGSKAKLRDIAREIGIKENAIEKILEIYVDPISLEVEISKSKAGSQIKALKDFLISEVPTPLEEMEKKDELISLHEAIEGLPEPHKTFILRRFGFDDSKPSTLGSLAVLLKIKRERIKEVEKEAFFLLRERIKMNKNAPPTLGIIGGGFVGSAIANGFKHYTNVKLYDLDLSRSVNSYEDTIAQDVVFVCLPTPMTKNGSVDLTILFRAIERLSKSLGKQEFTKPVIIKSTVPPGVCQTIQRKFDNLFVTFNPEFLTERTAELDFMQQKRIILGVGTEEKTAQINMMKQLFRCRFPTTPIRVMHWDAASLVKYYSNVFFCMKVSVFNEFAQISEALGLNPNEIAGEVLEDGRIGRSHFLVPGHDGHKGYGGSCFCKDINGYMEFAEKLKVEATMAKASWKKNLEVRPGRDWEELKGRAVSE